jgi:lipopolysaccharide export system protein LptC
VVRFFKGPYYRFVTHKIIRWVIIVLFVIKLAVFIYFATKIQVNEEQVFRT